MAQDRSDEIVIWQPILEQVLAGRTTGHRCPYCQEGTLEVQADEFEVKIRCPKCSEGFYGQLA